MTDRVNLLRRVETLDIAPEFQPYSKVRVFVDDERYYEAGNDTGRTLEVTIPWGSQAIANQMLSRIRGFQFQPYKASGALLDPAAEMGDAASIKDIYGGIYTRSRVFGRLMKADISAPHDEEIDHEYKFKTPTERKFTRQIGEAKASIKITNDAIAAEVARVDRDVFDTKNPRSIKSTLNIQATEIAAKVSQTGGDNSVFGWSLKSSEFGLYSGDDKVFYVNRRGAYVDGEIRATKGRIGGFDIGEHELQYNGLVWGDTNKTTGVYIGQSGIQLGKAFKVTNQGAVTASNLIINGGSIKIGSNFSVNSSGNVSANNMTLTGTLKVGGKNITADALQQGAQSAYTNGGYWSGGAGYGYGYNKATSRGTTDYPEYFTAGALTAKHSINCEFGSVNGKSASFADGVTVGGYYTATWKSATIAGVTIYYLGR